MISGCAHSMRKLSLGQDLKHMWHMCALPTQENLKSAQSASLIYSRNIAHIDILASGNQFKSTGEAKNEGRKKEGGRSKLMVPIHHRWLAAFVRLLLTPPEPYFKNLSHWHLIKASNPRTLLKAIFFVHFEDG